MLRIKKMQRSMTNRRIFRTLARDNCGESMEPNEKEIMYFGYFHDKRKDKEEVVACSSLQLCDQNVTNIDSDDFYHWLTFLFVKKDYQRMRFGTEMVLDMVVDSFNFANRPLRVHAARKAVAFFSKCGFIKLNDSPRESCGGSSYFRYLYLMERDNGAEEDWEEG